jgi:CHAT domain-containing protein
VFGEAHPNSLASLLKLARFLTAAREFDEAEALVLQAMELHQTREGRESPWIPLLHLGRLHYARKDYEKAEPLLAEFVADLEVGRRTQQAQYRAGWLSAQWPSYSWLAATRLLSGKVEAAWPAVEQAHGRALADLLIASGERPLTAVEIAREDSLNNLLRQLEGELAAFRSASEENPGDETTQRVEEARMHLLEAEAEWSAFRQVLARKYPLTEGGVFTLERVQATLDERTALVGWFEAEIGVEHGNLRRGECACWGYVIRDQGPVHWVRLAPTAGGDDERALIDNVEDFRESLRFAASWPSRVSTLGQFETLSRTLWTERLSPLTRYLDDVERLILIPSGPMLGVPVEAFLDSTDTFIGDRYAIAYAPSARIHAWLAEQSAEDPAGVPRRTLLVGDPPFAGTRFPRLHHTQDEVDRVASSLRETTVLLGADASEEEMARLAGADKLREFDAIHLATHVLVDDRVPGRSAIVLSQENLPNPLEAALGGARIFDGLLTAKEIVREWKLDADLVTVSGCQTALGTEYRGEGYVGFAHALFRAGARSLLLSLWDVDDTATAFLMGRFYENLAGSGREKRGDPSMSKAAALREAKRWLREYTDAEGNRPFQHPAYWSAFVLIGDAG